MSILPVSRPSRPSALVPFGAGVFPAKPSRFIPSSADRAWASQCFGELADAREQAEHELEEEARLADLIEARELEMDPIGSAWGHFA